MRDRHVLSGVGEDTNRPCHDAMDVNFWGAVKVSIGAARFFREVNPNFQKGAGGMLVQVSSMAGTTGVPLVGFYITT
ncbi:hypothetical protein EV702DRAFT_1096627 [Suillus placidus]|uniref:Uncharacterized protein n=1 Tax=Suillus placidus TaxID=48579 RepID=A0A9P7D455_9AGAM|nr:hypothetical protein EV702DRAFT_1096627 [Suillus placidus]